MSAPKFARGDVVWFLMKFPDGTGEKKLRALVIGDPIENANRDYVLMQITSQTWNGRTDYILRDDDPEFAQSGLDCTSTFRGHKLFVVTESTVVRKAGSVGPKTLAGIEMAVKSALGLR